MRLPSASAKFFKAKYTPTSPPAVATATTGSARTMTSASSPSKDDGKPMYRFESTLPHLPVPTLENTAARYLKSVGPFATPATSTAVANFLTSPLVKTLQERLHLRAGKEENWLSDWWNEYAYMGYRGPNVPWVNYFYVHRDDKLRLTGPKRAAGLVRGLLYFRQMSDSYGPTPSIYSFLLACDHRTDVLLICMCSESLEPEYAKKLPLCMASYKYLFNSYVFVAPRRTCLQTEF